MSKYPQGALNEIDSTEVQEMVGSLRELYDLGRCVTDDEVEQRISDYFSFCQQSSLRPGVEGLCMALHIGRTTLFNWSNGIKCSERRQELIQGAKSFISAYIESAVLCGKISPPSGIFLMKNWLGYKDSISIEESTPKENNQIALTVADLPRLADFNNAIDNLPKLSNDGGDDDV